ncbi:MAG: hypothetical protein ABSB99_10075 [Acidimicrobiales bacterium]|jgi:hypothetical protein
MSSNLVVDQGTRQSKQTLGLCVSGRAAVVVALAVGLSSVVLEGPADGAGSAGAST